MNAERFAERLRVVESGCWEWQGYCRRDGYGVVFVEGNTTALVHRVAYALHVGPIPDELTVDHLCFNPPCANPDHLRLLSRSENARLQRSAFVEVCKNGHPYDEANTYYRPSNKRSGSRDCRACIRNRVRRYQAKKAAA